MSAQRQISRPAYSATTIWATAPGFTGWGDLPGGQPLLIADRASYRPGETATLLLTTPFPQTPVLITRRATDGLAGEARTIRAGEPFTLTVRPEDAPALALAVLFAGNPPLGTAAAAPPPPLLATADLPVRDDQADLLVGIVSDRSDICARRHCNADRHHHQRRRRGRAGRCDRKHRRRKRRAAQHTSQAHP